MAVIEMLCYSGIIEIKEKKNENIEWVLSKNWNKKIILVPRWVIIRSASIISKKINEITCLI